MKKILNLTLLLLIPTLLFSHLSCKTAPKSKTDSLKVVLDADTINILTNEEKTQGWALLFDGKTLTGWKGYNKDTIPSRWIVKDYVLQTARKQIIKHDNELTGDIITSDQFESFELSWEWKMTPQGNSGVIY